LVTIKTSLPQALFATQIGNRGTSFIVVQNSDNLAIRKSCLFHVDLLRLRYEKILAKIDLNSRGITYLLSLEVWLCEHGMCCR